MYTRNRLSGGVALGAVMLMMTGQAVAQEAGDPLVGQQIAKTWCVNCHVVDPAQQRGTSNGAPPFAAIAGMKSTTPMALRAFLQTPHTRMPDLHLSRAEIDDVSAYILSLRQ